MTDLLLLGNKACVVQLYRKRVVCSVEVGADVRYKAVDILIPAKMKRWLDKVGEMAREHVCLWNIELP